MITKYRTGSYRVLIEVVEVERETESSVWIKGSRNGKITNWHCYFDTWQEAYDYIEKEASDSLSNAKAKYDRAEDIYQSILSLKEK